jgi:hypothetical protein
MDRRDACYCAHFIHGVWCIAMGPPFLRNGKTSSLSYCSIDDAACDHWCWVCDKFLPAAHVFLFPWPRRRSLFDSGMRY